MAVSVLLSATILFQLYSDRKPIDRSLNVYPHTDLRSYRVVIERRLANIVIIITLSTAAQNSWSRLQLNHCLRLRSHDVLRLSTHLFLSIFSCIITRKRSYRWPPTTRPKYSSLHVFMIVINSFSVDYST